MKKNSETVFQSWFGSSNDAVFIMDDKGLIIEANDNVFRQSGISKNERAQLTFFDLFIWPELAEYFRNDNKDVQSFMTGIQQVKKKDNIPVEISISPVSYHKKQVMLCIVRNISEIDIKEGTKDVRGKDSIREKRAEKATQKAHEELKRTLRLNEAFLSAIPTPVFFKDKEGRYLGCNRAFTEFMGVTSDQIKGKTVFELWPGEHAEVYHKKDLELIQKPERQVYEFKVRDKNGIEHPVIYSKDVFRDENDKIAGIVGAFLDITKRKNAEKIIDEERNLLRTLVDTIPDLVYIKDTESRFVIANKTLAEILGRTPESLVGLTDIDLFPEELSSDFYNDERELVKTGKPVVNKEEYIFDTHGNQIYVQTTKIPLYSDNDISGFVGAGHIITEQKKMAEALQKRVIALTRPLDDPEGIKFTDLFNIDELQAIQDSFARATGVASIFTFPDGKPITRPSNFSRLCTMIRETENGRLNCEKSDATLGKLSMEGPRIQPCLSCGLWDASSSITLGGKHMANWMIGQVRDESLEEEKIMAYAQELGLSREQYQKALMEIPSMSKPQFENVCRALYLISNQLSLKAYQNVQQARFITEQGAAEKALKESEERYRLIAENTADTIAVFDMNLNPTYVSPSILKLRGFTVQEAMTQSLDQILVPESLQKTYDLFAVQMAQEDSGEFDPTRTTLLELEEYCKNGTTIWVEATVSFLRDKNLKPDAILTVTRDISERKRAEKLQTAIYHISEAAQIMPGLEKLFESIHTIIGDLMPAQNFYIALYNPATEEIHFPYYTDEYDSRPEPKKLGRGLTDYVLVTGKPLLAPQKVFEQLVASGKVESIGTPSLDWLGVPLKTQRGETIGVMAVQTYSEDIHLNETHELILEFVSTQVAMAIERKRVEEALYRSEEKYRSLVENLSDVIFTVDAQGFFTYISPAIEHYTGYITDQVIGMPFTRFIHPDDLDGLMSSFERSLNGHFESYEFRVLNIDGSVRHVRTSSRKLIEEGKLVGLTGIMSDITEQKKSEEELKKAKENAEESNRLKSAFLATMNHELRTPLNHIIGFSDLIRSGTIMENVTDYADIIHKSSQNLLEIIEDIFELALVEQSEVKLRLQTFKCLDLFLSNKSVLTEILEISGKKEQIELTFNADTELLLQNITSDRNKINQVLLNLFKNAVKFTKSGTIEFGMKSEEPGWLTFIVGDTGIGIPEGKHNVVFEFFRQADDSHTREYGGVGIGLAISQKIAEVMHGTLYLDSTPGKGSKFYFKIPVSSSINNPHFVSDMVGTIAPNLRGNTILIAEDDPLSIELVRRFLSDTGAQLFVATNGKEAIESLNKNPNAILMDLNMPVMDGYTATRIIKSVSPFLPVIALTAYALSVDKNKAEEAGCDFILSKPVDQKVLFEVLKKYLIKD